MSNSTLDKYFSFSLFSILSLSLSFCSSSSLFLFSLLFSSIYRIFFSSLSFLSFFAFSSICMIRDCNFSLNSFSLLINFSSSKNFLPCLQALSFLLYSFCFSHKRAKQLFFSYTPLTEANSKFLIFFQL